MGMPLEGEGGSARLDAQYAAATAWSHFSAILRGLPLSPLPRRFLGLEPVDADQRKDERREQLEWEEFLWTAVEAGIPASWLVAGEEDADDASPDKLDETRSDWPAWARLIEGVRLRAQGQDVETRTAGRIRAVYEARNAAGLDRTHDWVEEIGRGQGAPVGFAHRGASHFAWGLGLSAGPLPCLVVALKSLCRRELSADQLLRALNQLAGEASDGLAILDDLEVGYRLWARSMAGRRGGLAAQLAYLLLYLPACDVPWIARTLDVSARGIRKALGSFMEKSSGDPLLLEWGRRLPTGQAPPEIIYWAPHLAGAWGPVVKAIGKLRSAPAGRGASLSEEELFQAAAGLSPDRPMSDIYDDFDAALASWDAEFGAVIL
tara:strand:+ start:4728 stop:5858 length:1131 start_codon:yes stop_codon:yes gene_type:complete